MVLLSGCSGIQSALSPAGEEAQAIHRLLIVAVVGAAIIWPGLVALIVHAGSTRRRVYSEETGQKLILWGGTVVPTALLACLLGYALWLMPATRPWFQAAAGDALRIEATGEQFWWRFRYLDASGNPLFETANEIRLPVGEPVQFMLNATDVIHSFWCRRSAARPT